MKKILVGCLIGISLMTFLGCETAKEEKGEKIKENVVSEEKKTVGKVENKVEIGEKKITVSKSTVSKSESEKKTTVSETPKEKEPESIPISIGQKVVTENCEFTLNKVELSYDVKPQNPPSYYTHYPASDGQVYIYINATVKNIQKQSLECDEIYSVEADYDNGYKYIGFNIVNDSDGDFTYANINSVEPLQTRGVHCLIDCPEEVETSSKPLSITIKMKDGSEYLYKIR